MICWSCFRLLSLCSLGWAISCYRSISSFLLPWFSPPLPFILHSPSPFTEILLHLFLSAASQWMLNSLLHVTFFSPHHFVNFPFQPSSASPFLLLFPSSLSSSPTSFPLPHSSSKNFSFKIFWWRGAMLNWYPVFYTFRSGDPQRLFTSSRPGGGRERRGTWWRLGNREHIKVLGGNCKEKRRRRRRRREEEEEEGEFGGGREGWKIEEEGKGGGIVMVHVVGCTRR